MVSVCATAVVNLFAINQGLLVWWLFALLGVWEQRADEGGRETGMELNFKQNNHKSRELLGLGCL